MIIKEQFTIGFLELFTKLKSVCYKTTTVENPLRKSFTSRLTTRCSFYSNRIYIRFHNSEERSNRFTIRSNDDIHQIQFE